MTGMSIGLISFSLCSADTTTQSCTVGIRRISLYSFETSACGTSRTIIHGNVRMHQHFSTRSMLVKKRPSASLRRFRQIG